MGQRINMGEERIWILLLKLSLPATIAMLVNASYNVVDTIFVGRLGYNAIAALSISFPIQMIIGAVAIGTGVGAGSLISRKLGAGNNDDASIVVSQSLVLSIVLGILATLFGLLFLEDILKLFGATPVIMDNTVDYMSVIFWGAIAMFIPMVMNHVIRAEGNAIVPMVIMIISVVINIVLDPIFIFVLDLGIKGAAIATVIAKVVAVLLMIHYLISGKSILKIRIKDMYLNLRIIGEIYKVGIPAMLTMIAANISMGFANIILSSYGEKPIAVMGIFSRLQMFVFMPCFGINQGLISIIGYNYGAKKILRIRESVLKAGAMAVLFVSFMGLLMFVFPGFFIGIFNNNPELINMGQTASRIMVIMFPLVGLQIVFSVFFQGIGKGFPSLVVSALRQFFLFIPFILIFERIIGLTGIWVAVPVADFLSFIITFIWVYTSFKTLGINLITGKFLEKGENTVET